MLAEYLDHAAALARLIESEKGRDVQQEELAHSVTSCCETLLLWGEAQQALALLDLMLAESGTLEPDVWIGIQATRARALVQLQANREARDLLEEVRRRLEEFPASSISDVQLVSVLGAQALWQLNRPGEALKELERLRTELLDKPSSVVGAACSAAMSSCHIMTGRWAEARRLALEALVLARRSGAAYYEAFSQNVLCMAERGLCRWDNSIEAADAAIGLYGLMGAKFQTALVQRSLAISQWKQGHLSKAASTTADALEVFQAGNHFTHVLFGRLLESLIRLHAGDAAAAASLLVPLSGSKRPPLESRPELLRLEYLGDVELEQGHFEAALKRYDEVLPHALALIPRGDVVAELRRRRAECMLALGLAKEADAEAKLALELCLELGDRYEEAATYRTLALAAAALGKYDEAKKHFVHGFAMYDDIETPYEWGKLWMSYGDWLSGKHAGSYESLSGAREAYRAACDHFEHMGAELKLAQARERMSVLGARIREEGVAEPAAGAKPRPRRRPSMDRELQRRVQWAFDTFGIVTRNRPFLELLEQVSAVAVSDIPVLVLGESGTGKELIARGVHSLSGRTGELVEVNCSAVPTTMMESEFFGSMHGSYTGSLRDRAGLIETAHEGSIFLDEIGEMPVDLQAKLLRFLETGEVRRIGANAGRKVDARLIAATNREATKMQSGEGFRQDLYYRLAHAVFTLPPLRSRGDDVELLVDHFLDTFNRGMRKNVGLAESARERLLGYSWPGNVRQLRSLMQRLIVQTPDGRVITPRDIPLTLSETTEAPRSFLEEMESQEKVRILEALEKTDYIKSDAARVLRMSRTTLLGKMKRYQIEG